MLTKKVNIFPRGAITATNPPIRSPQSGVVKDIKDIRYCILAGAKVEELLPEGKKVVLNLQNYDLDNSKSPYATSSSGATIFASSPKNSPIPIIQSPMTSVEPNPFQITPEEKKQDMKAEKQSTANTDAKITEAPSLPATDAISASVNTSSEEPEKEEKAAEAPLQGESTQNPDKPRLTKKERRALERAAAQEGNKTEPEVVVTDPELN